MNYERFKKAIARELKQYLPTAYQDWELEIEQVPKVNGYKDGIHLVAKGEFMACPTLYVEDLYEHYRECNSLDTVCQNAASAFVQSMAYAKKLYKYQFAQLAEMDKNRIIFCLISKENNEKLLQDVPHRMTLNLAVIYRIMLDSSDGGFDSAVITNAMAEEMNLNEEDLFVLAKVNTPQIMPLDLKFCEEVAAIATNKHRVLGASVILYSETLQEVANHFGGNLYILPSSIHEVFLVPDVGQNVASMNRMVEHANQTVTRPEEVLSNTVYYYDVEFNKVTIPEVV